MPTEILVSVTFQKCSKIMFDAKCIFIFRHYKSDANRGILHCAYIESEFRLGHVCREIVLRLSGTFPGNPIVCLILGAPFVVWTTWSHQTRLGPERWSLAWPCFRTSAIARTAVFIKCAHECNCWWHLWSNRHSQSFSTADCPGTQWGRLRIQCGRSDCKRASYQTSPIVCNAGKRVSVWTQY